VTEPREEEVAALRDALAAAMSRNVELEGRLDAIERDRNELGIDAVARSVVGAARAAVDTMADGGGDADGSSVPYVIPRLEVTVRGLVGRQGDGFAVRFPGPESSSVTPALSTISMTVAHVPAPRPKAQPDRYRAGLEAIQAAASAWSRDRGRKAAGEIAALATHLLSSEARADESATLAGLAALADAVLRFDAQAGAELQPAARDRQAVAAKGLSELSRGVIDAGVATSDDLAGIGSLLVALAGAMEEGSTPP
jgi:hypothetical protein